MQESRLNIHDSGLLAGGLHTRINTEQVRLFMINIKDISSQCYTILGVLN